MNIRLGDRPKPALVLHSGIYQYICMPFGHTNTPESFQHALELILTKYKWKACFFYLADITIFSKSIEELICHVDNIIKSLYEAGVTVEIKKCKFFTSTVEALGHIIRPENSRLIALVLRLSNIHSLLQTNRNCAPS